MTMLSKITLARQKIEKVIDELAYMILGGGDSFEADLSPDTTCYLEVDNNHNAGYTAIELVSVTVEHDSPVALRSLTNIAGYIADKLCRKISFANADNYRYAREWQYQEEYETIAGIYT